ncbi:MAG: LptF/LptG family permease [Opitutales bacterium]|jgi:lipopolysaccharide export system permease protein
MLILSRYLARAIAVTSLSGILLFVFILITGNAMRDILGLLAEGTIPFSLFIELLWLLVPYAFSFAMPLGVLIGILLTMGRLSANQELTALKAAGISLSSVAAPVLFVALCGSFLAIYINTIHAPSARASYKSILNALVRTDPLRFIVPRTFIHDFPGYVLYVGEKEEGRMKEFWLWELDQQKRAVRLLRADEGTFAFDEATDSLVLTLVDGFTELRDTNNPDNLQALQPTLSFRDARIRLPLANLLGAANQPRRLANYTMEDLLERKRSAEEIVTTRPGTDEARLARDDEVRTQYHISRRFAMAASVFSLALFAVPLGIRVGRTETHANFAVALSIALTYYIVLVVIGWTEGSSALRPDLLVWIPNFVAQGLGFYLLGKASQH